MRTAIALGANLGDRLGALRDAREAVLKISGISGPVISSPVYETAPMDCAPGTPSFYNAVLEVDCTLNPVILLDQLQGIEAAMGRPSKRPRNAPRPIDLDVLYIGNTVLQNEEIVIPHPRLHLRRFVLEPLAAIAPDRILPGLHLPITTLLERLDDGAELRLITSTW